MIRASIGGTMPRRARASLVSLVSAFLVSITPAAANGVQAAPTCTPAFSGPVIQPMPGVPRLLLVTDLNNDHAQDVVATSEPVSSGDVSIVVLLGNGSGFSAPSA